MRGKGKVQNFKLTDSAYVVEHPETGLQFSLCGSKAKLKPAPLGTLFPAGKSGRLDTCLRILELLQPEAGYEVVRRDA